MKGKNKNKCNVLLINPCISGEARYDKFKDVGSYLPPYGLLSIAGSLEHAGCCVRVLDADSKKGMSLNEIKSEILKFTPGIIGMTAYSIGRDNVIETARFIKSFYSNLLVVGGPHVITFPEDLIDCQEIDIHAYGEGELIAIELVEYYLKKKALDEIDGIIYKENGKIIKNSPRKLIEDMDSLPYPAFHLLDNLSAYKPMQLLLT